MTINCPRFAKVVAERVWMTSIWLSLIPGGMGTLLWLLYSVSLLLWFERGTMPDRRFAFSLLNQGGLVVWAICTAIHQRLDPILRRFFGGAALLCGGAMVLNIAKETLIPAVFPNADITLRSVVRIIYILLVCIGGGSIVLWAYVRGLRKRQQAVPSLVQVLTSGRKSARRKAVFALMHIELWDSAAARAEGPAWLKPMWDWLSKCDDPHADAIPALRRALQVDDFFVRRWAAKLLTRMGSTIAVTDPRSKTDCQSNG